MRRLINKLLLKLRIRFGKYAHYCHYFYRVYIIKEKQPHVLSIMDTLDHVLYRNVSLIRFGDGEISLIDGANLPFQEYNQELDLGLQRILSRKKNLRWSTGEYVLDDLLICISPIFGKMEDITKKEFLFHIHHLFKHGNTWKRLLSNKVVYGNSFVTRPYLRIKNPSMDKGQQYQFYLDVFTKWKEVWEDKDCVLIEGEASYNGYGNDLFSGVNSLKRMRYPNRNAFSQYDGILGRVLEEPKDRLILLALGCAAKVLAYELYKQGYRVIDIGHLDMEYEMFLRGEDKIVPVAGKYFSELGKIVQENEYEYKIS